jgi:hypothetical protein
MCGGSHSETHTTATENVTTTDYGAITEAEKILQQSTQLVAQASLQPQDQTDHMLLIGGLLVALTIVARS